MKFKVGDKVRIWGRNKGEVIYVSERNDATPLYHVEYDGLNGEPATAQFTEEELSKDGTVD